MIAQRRRRDGQAKGALSSQVVNAFVRNFGVKRRFRFKSWQQLAHGTGIEQRAAQAVLAQFASFLQNVNIFFGDGNGGIAVVVSINQLRQPQRACQTRRPAADNDDIGLHLRAGNAFEGFSEDDHAQLVQNDQQLKINDLDSSSLS